MLKMNLRRAQELIEPLKKGRANGISKAWQERLIEALEYVLEHENAPAYKDTVYLSCVGENVFVCVCGERWFELENDVYVCKCGRRYNKSMDEIQSDEIIRQSVALIKSRFTRWGSSVVLPADSVIEDCVKEIINNARK